MSNPTYVAPHAPTTVRSRTRSKSELGRDFARIRKRSEALCEPLDAEDLVAQSMPDASPLKWHLAHTTWFFEMMVLKRFVPGYALHHPDYPFLFNSYYNALGDRHARPLRGVLTRPSTREVMAFREAVDSRVLELLAGDPPLEAEELIVIGLAHEEQHQELMLTDLKHLFSMNALCPVYRPALPAKADEPPAMGFVGHPADLYEIGHSAHEEGEVCTTLQDFAFDNEGPRHRVYLEAFAIADRLVTNGEYLAFIEDDGYARPELWLDAGWSRVQQEDWTGPMYWRWRDGVRREFTLAGERDLVHTEPVCHVSHFEADAFARWAGKRLPSEAEWEVAAETQPVTGHFVDDGRFHPTPADAHSGAPLAQIYGDVWEWTASAYGPYPGFAPRSDALAEYNGKFMSGQMVLRGGSCATPEDHVRPSYRNFFHPPDRWQFTGIRLAGPPTET